MRGCQIWKERLKECQDSLNPIGTQRRAFLKKRKKKSVVCINWRTSIPQRHNHTQPDTHITVQISTTCFQKDEQDNTRGSSIPISECRILNPPVNVWKIPSKMNYLQLMWWQLNHLKMMQCQLKSSLTAGWLAEPNYRPQCSMCTSSVVHTSSNVQPFFTSRQVCHLILFSHDEPPFCILLISCVFSGVRLLTA